MPSVTDASTIDARLNQLESQVRHFRIATIGLAGLLVVGGLCGAARYATESHDQLKVGTLHVQEIKLVDADNKTRGSLTASDDEGAARLVLFDRPAGNGEASKLFVSAKPGDLVFGLAQAKPSKALALFGANDGADVSPQLFNKDAQGKMVFQAPAK
jgi:hypothetical protein